jgi:hypothetical protein
VHFTGLKMLQIESIIKYNNDGSVFVMVVNTHNQKVHEHHFENLNAANNWIAAVNQLLSVSRGQ